MIIRRFPHPVSFFSPATCLFFFPPTNSFPNPSALYLHSRALVLHLDFPSPSYLPFFRLSRTKSNHNQSFLDCDLLPPMLYVFTLPPILSSPLCLTVPVLTFFPPRQTKLYIYLFSVTLAPPSSFQNLPLGLTRLRVIGLSPIPLSSSPMSFFFGYASHMLYVIVTVAFFSFFLGHF